MSNSLKKVLVLFFACIFTGFFNLLDAHIEEKAKKILIVYFSYTGNTEKIVNETVKALGNSYKVDIHRIETFNEYPEDRNELRNQAEREANDDKFRPELKALNIDDIRSYDLIIIGTPTWWYKAPKAVLAFLEGQDLSAKKVCFFVTHAGGPGACLDNMRKASKGANFGPEVKIYCTFPVNGEFDEKAVESWLTELKKELL